MKKIEEHWNGEERQRLIKSVDTALNDGKTLEVAFQIAENIFQKPVEQCKHVYNMERIKNNNVNKGKISKGEEDVVEMKQPRLLNNDELYNETIKYYRTGKTISQSIKSVCDKYNLKFGSVKARWYKLLKNEEEYAQKFELDKKEYDQSIMNSRNTLETKLETEELVGSDVININIKFINEFYLKIKDNPEILSKLIIYKDLTNELEETREKFRQITSIIDNPRGI